MPKTPIVTMKATILWGLGVSVGSAQEAQQALTRFVSGVVEKRSMLQAGVEDWIWSLHFQNSLVSYFREARELRIEGERFQRRAFNPGRGSQLCRGTCAW